MPRHGKKGKGSKALDTNGLFAHGLKIEENSRYIPYQAYPHFEIHALDQGSSITFSRGPKA